MRPFFKNFDKWIFLYRKSNINKKIVILHLCFSKLATNLENFSEDKRYNFFYRDVEDIIKERKVWSKKQRRYI